MLATWRNRAEEAATRADAERVVERWNRDLRSGRDLWWSPTIRCAVVAGAPWLDVHCPGCGTSRMIDVRTIDRHPLASVGSLVLGLRCSWCQGAGPMPKVLGLHGEGGGAICARHWLMRRPTGRPLPCRPGAIRAWASTRRRAGAIQT
jgi:hypothetical protein